MSTESAALDFYDDSQLRRVLCVVAHPDDMEYGGSAAVARWTAQGVEVSYLLLTAGEAGMRSQNPKDATDIRAQEQRRACELVGVSDLVILDLPDGTLEPSLEARRQIARRIRQVRPDMVLTQTWDLQVGWGLNHADHRAAGLATLDAIRDADNPWVFRELFEKELLEPWGVKELLVFGGAPNHVIDISGEALQQGLDSLEAHEQYLAELGGSTETRNMLEAMAASQAEGIDGVDHALGVAVHSM